MQVLKTLRRNRLETGALTVAAVSVAAVAAVPAAVAVVNAAAVGAADSHFPASSATFVFVFAAAVANCN